MGGLTRREMLKASAVAGGVAWAAPFLSTGTAWADVNACACDGAIVYAKFAPGNAQTCDNQCLAPGPTVARLDFGCLVDNGIINPCDDKKAGNGYASMAFSAGVTPIKLAMKTTSDCFVSRCNDGFHKVYKWVPSTNAEPFDDTPCDGSGTSQTLPPGHNGCVFVDPSSTDTTGMFQTYTGGDNTGGPCTGAQGGNAVPGGTLCGSSAQGSTGCNSSTITGVVFNTAELNQPINFIEMELCITNLSKIPCAPVIC